GPADPDLDRHLGRPARGRRGGVGRLLFLRRLVLARLRRLPGLRRRACAAAGRRAEAHELEQGHAIAYLGERVWRDRLAAPRLGAIFAFPVGAEAEARAIGGDQREAPVAVVEGAVDLLVGELEEGTWGLGPAVEAAHPRGPLAGELRDEEQRLSALDRLDRERERDLADIAEGNAPPAR